MVAEIRSSAARVGMAGNQVSEGSAALSQRTEEQAASLRQTLATVQVLSEAVADPTTKLSLLAPANSVPKWTSWRPSTVISFGPERV